MTIHNRQAVRRHRLKRAVAAAAETAMQTRKTSGQALPYAGQPIAVGRFVVFIGIDRLFTFGGAQWPGLNAVGPGRPEV